MLKTHVEILSDIFRTFHKDLKEQGNKLSEFFDRIVVWLISLSTGAIVLILTSFDKISLVGKSAVNYTLILLVTAIICGVLGRIFYAIATYIAFSFSALFDLQLMMLEIPHDPRELEGTETSEEIYEIIKEDFKIEVPLILEHKKLVPKEKWIEADKQAREFYANYLEWSSESLTLALKKINKVSTETFGYKENYFENKRNGNNRFKGKLLRLFTALSYLLYICSAVAFTLSVLQLTINFIGNNK